MALFAVFLIPIAGWFVWVVTQAIETGVINHKGITARRDKQPYLFWLFTGFYAIMAPAALIAGVMVMVGAIWPSIV